jgi:hypothetical protein
MDTTSRVDRMEKTARLVLWLSIASACVIVPIEYVRQTRAGSKAEAERQAAAKKADAKEQELESASKPHRLAFASMGMYLSSINYAGVQGNLWSTNVSSRAGTICVVGEARDPEVSIKTAVSLPACQEVGAYASEVHLSLMFAGGDLAAACPKSNCRLSVKDAFEPAE